MYATLTISADDSVTDSAIEDAVVTANQLTGQHPGYPVQLRWQRKP